MVHKFLAIGNITKDELILKSGKFISFGGTSYSAIAATRLGYKAHILCRSNHEIDPWVKRLNEEGIHVEVQPDKHLTFFVNDYSFGERRQLLPEHTGKIVYKSSEKMDIIHFNPMFGEISLESIKKARKNCEILSLDVQGLVRATKNKKVVGKFWNKREEFLKHIDFLKVGKNEINLVSRKGSYREICEELSSMGAKVVALTLGEKGSIVFKEDYYEIPAYKTEGIDPTGAGDIYATAFAIKYFETKDALNSGLFASASASFVVEGFGPKNIASREKVEERYKKLREKIENKRA
jgi:sugar/nucleoside kinase (ribokinase family)